MSREDFKQAEALGEPGYNENVLPVVEAGQAVIVDSDYVMNDNFLRWSNCDGRRCLPICSLELD